ncbi:C4-dicarboxylate TRAP transporter substrate-binding protein [Ancylobacter mangrovi]|uniref:C4-dicarboxylate TRAP transporter substrate-binding protein n=1 Tax=Ancylobacter mangrovi TaxID=2972472 RepID=UPI002163F947|nr:C4-dicarboxylate TRAP transporter substrate-binding protein [Ancylobacter mangrovi]MCS0502757.1 C4-dicarboxylate TRAP transporter substrate-binding protein [Ancylobacter mangrovi]
MFNGTLSRFKTLGLAAGLATLFAGTAMADYKLNLSTSQTAQDPLVLAMQSAKKKIEERTKGEVTITIYPSSQLGSDNDVIEQIRNGANIAVLVDAGRLAPFKKELGILAAPYLVDDYTQYAAITSSPVYHEWVEDMAKTSGLRLLNYNWFQGTREMFTNKPVHTPADLKGVRVRTIDAPGWVATVNAMGATAVPMPWSEVYSALQLGAIDGAEAQLTGAYGIKLHEVTKNLAFTNHVQLFTGLLTSEAWYQSLPEDLRKIVVEELAAAGDEATRNTVAKGKEVLETMKKAGVQVNDVDVSQFSALVPVVYEKMGLEDARKALQPYINKTQ